MRLPAALARALRLRRSAAAALLVLPVPLWLAARGEVLPRPAAEAAAAEAAPGPAASTKGQVAPVTAAPAEAEAPSLTAAPAEIGAPPSTAPSTEAEAAPVTAAGAEALVGPASPAAVTRDPELRPLRAGPRPAAFDAGRAPLRVRVDGQVVPYRVLAVLALPGRPVRVEVAGDPSATTLRHAAGTATVEAPGRWRWTPPEEPGIHALRVEGPSGVVHLNALVLHPRDELEGGRMHGYDIGAYREQPLRGDPVYLPPRGFVEVRAEDHDVLLSPHLSLGQFRCKQPGEPRYVHVTPALLMKLEAVLEAANAAGYDAPGFYVMSGFRTPAYNRAIGNTTSYSRHLWGDAADVWVDADGDGEMDDWNRDGRIDREDARVLLRIAERVEGKEGVSAGGLGLYRRNAVHGPFVHVDARGYAARW